MCLHDAVHMVYDHIMRHVKNGFGMLDEQGLQTDLSRAYRTVSSMLSNSRAYPIHSLTITSTCSILQNLAALATSMRSFHLQPSCHGSWQEASVLMPSLCIHKASTEMPELCERVSSRANGSTIWLKTYSSAAQETVCTGEKCTHNETQGNLYRLLYRARQLCPMALTHDDTPFPGGLANGDW